MLKHARVHFSNKVDKLIDKELYSVEDHTQGLKFANQPKDISEICKCAHVIVYILQKTLGRKDTSHSVYILSVFSFFCSERTLNYVISKHTIL